jgi:hypothetical protein
VLRRFLLISLLWPLISGCAGTPVQPAMTPDNPTNANAVEAPLPPPSTTLNSEMPSDGQLTPESTGPMKMHGMSGEMKGMDMKGMYMKQDGSMPGMQNRPTSGRGE